MVSVPVIAAPQPGAQLAIVVPRVHLIEVIPHPNGELLLSYTAVTRQEPAFFGHPFTGWSTPKISSNQAYPMLTPDPIVDIEIYDSAGALVAAERDHSLNVVDYARKHEVRITIPNGRHALIPPMSVLELERDPSPSLDFRLRFYPPGSAAAAAAVPNLTATMPRGSLPVARRYGWR